MMHRSSGSMSIIVFIFVFLLNLVNGQPPKQPYAHPYSTAQPTETTTAAAPSVAALETTTIPIPPPTEAPAPYPHRHEPESNPGFNCHNHPSGVHPDPHKKCSDIYYMCSNGITIKRNCPQGLAFDRHHKACEFKEYVFDCSGKKKPSPSPLPPQPKPSPASLPSTEFNCKGKKAGSYLPPSSKCSKHYFKCVGDVTQKVKCPQGLYYDIEKDQCENFADVYACSGKRPQPTTPTTTQTPPTTEKVPVDCSKLTNGDHPDPENKCSSKYYTCSNGIGTRRRCAPGTFFDRGQKSCDTREHVPDCNGKPRPPVQPSTVNLASPTTKPPYDCEKKDDGHYPAGKCSSTYWICDQGTTIKGTCPGETFFDHEKKQCGFKNEMPECGGTRPSQPEKPVKPYPYS